jgi:SAM-dependent methyltransferase
VRAIQFKIKGPSRILDLGWGTGWSVAEAEIDGTPIAIGIDRDAPALRQAAVRYPRISFAAADGLKLPFADGAFDCVIGHVSMPYMDTRQALSEIHRVLALGGRFYVTLHSFGFVWDRFRYSLSHANWRDCLFMGYVALNGILNHFGMLQIQAPWKSRTQTFETFNTRRGAVLSGVHCGFESVATDYKSRIFFRLSGLRSANPGSGIRVSD